jgi:threonine synthase
LDPHGAVGWQALTALRESGALGDGAYVALATAHPAKFQHVVEPITGPVTPPRCLEEAMGRTVNSITIPPDFKALTETLRRGGSV